MEHYVYREAKELLTQVWVWAGYLQYCQVPYSHPACYEFLWGLWAYAETSNQQVNDYLQGVPGSSHPSLQSCEGGGRGALSQSSSPAPFRPMSSSLSWGQEGRLICV